MPLSLLITVGTTQFPSLTDHAATASVLRSLFALGVTSLTVQHGHAPFRPPPPTQPPSPYPTITAFPFTTDLSSHIAAASIVVSHAGAGTISEAVALRKRLLVVVNDALMHDHQTELACAMAARRCCIMTRGCDLYKDFIHRVQETVDMDVEQARLPQKAPWALPAIVAQELVQP